MILSINSSNPDLVVVKIGTITETFESQNRSRNNVFGCILATLEKNHLNKNDITGIEVNEGPGSFTGTRVGVALANALSFALKVPLVDHTKYATPIYSEEPHVTFKKTVDKK